MSHTRARVRSMAVLVFVLPVLVQCSNDDDAEDGCRQMMDAVVEPRQQPLLACGANAYCAVIGKLASEGTVRYRITELATCIDEIHALGPCTVPDTWPLTLLYRFAPACAAAFGGGRTEGERCSSSIECGWHSVCEGDPTVCKKMPGLGESCQRKTAGHECQDGLFCDAPTALEGDIGTCQNGGWSCPSDPIRKACTNESVGLGGACHPQICVDTPASTGGGGHTFCGEQYFDCGGGLACDPATTYSNEPVGKCVMPATFR